MVVYTSGTQLEVWDACIRKWFFKWVLKLAEVVGPARPFGTVFHSVAQRYLDGDDTGRDKKGEPVNLTPEGWLETDDGIVSDADGALILRLVEMGIKEGIFDKLPDRLTEERFEREVIPGVKVVGYMDTLYPNEDRVDDHKTTSDWRWALSPERIEKDPKMLTYAAEVFMRKFEAEEELPDCVFLRHNQFLKADPVTKKSVRIRQGSVTQEEVEKFWEYLKATAESMLEAHQFHASGELKYEDVPCSRDGENYGPCNAYGGCPFLRICTDQETVDGYRKRLDRILRKTKSENVKDANKITKESDMSEGIFAKLKKNAAKQKPDEPKKEAPVEEPEVQEEEVTTPPPWAQEKCTACEGKGFNSKNDPCRICNSVNEKLGLPQSTAYVQTDEGWVLAEEVQEPGEEQEAPATTKKKAGRKKTAGLPSKKEKDKAPAKTKETSTAKPQPSAGALKQSRGRPPAGFTLCLHCAPTSFGSREVVSADVIFAAIQEFMVEENKEEGCESFYQLPPFPRRDRLAVLVDQYVDEIGAAFVTANPGSCGPDYKSFIEALKVHAQTVIEGSAA